MTQELRERVAEAACNAANGDGCWEETPCLPREAIWYPIADATIALVLEEAAKVVEDNERLRAALRPLACTCTSKHPEGCSSGEVDCPFWNARAALDYREMEGRT